jgi:prolyl oligopeptidase
MKTGTLIFSIFIFVAISCQEKQDPATAMPYPPTKKVDTVDHYFGIPVADPYRWLEDDTSRATVEWVEAQNAVTFSYLNHIPYRDAVKKRIESIVNYERYSAPFHEGDLQYFYKNDGLQNHSVLYRRKHETDEPEVFLDPNTFSKDGTTGLAGIYFSPDGSLATYLISEGGSDWRKAITIKTSDKSPVGDTLTDIKFSGIAWKGNDGFYYSSYEKPKGSELSSRTQHHKLLYHKLGTPQSTDMLVFGGGITPRRYISANITEDGRFLVVTAATSTTGNELYVQDLSDPDGRLVTLVDNFENDHHVVDNDGDRLIIQTNLKAPNFKIISVEFNDPRAEKWMDLVPESKNTMEGVSTSGKHIFINYLKDASTQIREFDYNGKPVREVELPGIGSASGFNGKHHENVTYYAFTSFTYPTTIFKYDNKSGTSTEYIRPQVDFDPNNFETRQVFFTSKDGTRVPMFIVHKKGVKLDGKNPTILYAYGGFSVNLVPGFSAARIVWLENGGIFAQPNLRGGGEYGEEWHQAGTKMKKQNVFDDYIAAANFLINERYTSSQYLALSGGSNGGLLVGATITQRPDLAKVALPDVGVLDMLRYHTFTAGEGWHTDYGTAIESKEMFEYLKAYSPVHAVKAGTKYPATMITTADHDDRVVPAHSFKFAATLQEHQQGDNPVLIRIDVKSGHGSSNLSKAIEKIADQYSFSWYSMGVLPPIAKKDM